METAALLVVDASRGTGRRVQAYFQEAGYDAEWVDTAEKAFNRLDARHFDVLVSELQVERVDGMRIMAVAKARNPEVCVVFTTRTPDIEHATEAMRQGAYDFQVKPLNLEKLEAVVQRGLAYQRLVLEQVALKQRLDERFGLGSLAGQSRAMSRLYTAVRQAAPHAAPVLLYGEPGTGKDAIAQAIHNGSTRRDGPFVKLDCAMMPGPVLDIEIFGVRGQAGRLELADQGTLYLDQADALGPDQRDRLVAFVANGVLRREDVPRGIPLNTRLVASLNQPAPAPDGAPPFFDGLACITIEVPPLRTRQEDIPLLAARMVEEVARTADKQSPQLTPRALGLLAAYDWPGNLRELRSIVEEMVAVARPGETLDVFAVPETVRRGVASADGILSIPVGTPLDEIERMAIEATLRACAHDKEQCAKTLGIGLRTLYRKLKDYRLR